MKKLLLYPFSADAFPLALHIKSTKGPYELAAVCAPDGMGLEGKDIGYAWNRQEIGVSVTSKVNQCLKNCDTVAILPHGNLDITDLRDYAQKLGKETLDFSEAIHQGEDAWCSFEECAPKALFEIKTPVIEVGGLIETADKDQILLALAKELQKRGLSISLLSPHDYIRLVGGHSFGFMQNVGENGFVKKFNHYIRMIELQEKPDIILIQTPGNFFRHDNRLIGDLGLAAFQFSQAFTPDYCVSSMLLGSYDDNFLKAFSTSLKERFGFSLDAIHISNKSTIWDKSMEGGEMTFYVNPVSNVKKCVSITRKNASFPAGDFFEAEDCERVVENVLKKLSREGDDNE